MDLDSKERRGGAPRRSANGVTERRQRVAALRLSGLRSTRKIAKIVGCSHATVATDLQAIDRAWRDVAIADVDVEKGRDVERLETLILTLWPRALRGELGAVAAVGGLIKQRAAIFGYTAPARVAGADGRGPVQVDHRLRLGPAGSDLTGYTSEEATALYALEAQFGEVRERDG